MGNMETQNKVFRSHFALLDVIERYMYELKALTTGKIMILLCASGVLTFLKEFVNRELFNDWSYLQSLFILIAIDTITGFIKAWKLENISSVKFGMLFAKCFLYALMLITINVLIHFKVGGVHPTVFDWIETFIFSAFIFREVVSIFENATIIYPDLFPKYVRKKLEQFDKEGFGFKKDEPKDLPK